MLPKSKDWKPALAWWGFLLLVFVATAAANYWSSYAALTVWGTACLVGTALLYRQRRLIRSEMAKIGRATSIWGIDYTKRGFYIALVCLTATGTAVLAAISGDRSATPFLFVTAVPNIVGLIVLVHFLLAEPLEVRG